MSAPRTLAKVGRWCLTFHRYDAFRTAYYSGGRATPGPWWSLTIRRIGEIGLSRDRTLFGWTDEETSS